MRLGIIAALTALCLTPVPAAADTPLERAVLAALNAARADPAAYAAGLRQYRTYFHARLLHYPGLDTDIETEEGVAAVDEAIAFLAHQAPLAPVAPAPLLAASAADLVADQAATGGTGHAGRDGSLPADRARNHSGGGFVAEVIAYGSVDAADVVRQLLVDDGVADRGHRVILYAPELRFAGVACGRHATFRTMCVIDLGITPDARAGERPAGPVRTAAH